MSRRRKGVFALLLGTSLPAVGGAISPPPPPPLSIAYDTTIGSSVDVNGFTTLPLRSGANRYFVGSGGSDANTGLSHAQRLATLQAAWHKVIASQGDQILIAEGTTLAETLPESGNVDGWLGDKPGFSALYPTVFSSYDPADPLNEAKYGMGHQRSARPILTHAPGAGNGAPAYFAVKGLVFNPGNVPNTGFNHVGSALKYVLYENCIFAFVSLSFTDAGDGVAAATAPHLIIRNCASYGVWTNTTAHVGNVYADGIIGLTYEDNVNYHSGWEIGASRDAANDAGGPDVFRHPYYFQANCTGIIIRRNLLADGAADGGIVRGDQALNEENVTIRCPSGTGIGPGNTFEFEAFPGGCHIETRYNLSLAAIDLNSTNLRGEGYTTGNLAPGSRIHHCLLIHNAATPGTGSDSVISTTGGVAYGVPTQATYVEFEYNRMVSWSTSGDTIVESSSPIHNFYGDNIWDNPTSGTNTNFSAVSFPNAYTEASLYVAAGYADYASLIADAIANPEKHIQRNLRSLAFAGYGMVASASLEADQTAPTLSSTGASATGFGTATLTVTTNEGNGTIYTILSTSATPPHVSQIKVGVLADGSSAPKSGSTLVTTTGVQSLNLSGIPSGTYYAHFVHQDSTGNKSSAVSTSATITVSGFTAATWNPADMSATNMTLTNGNLTATTAGAAQVGVRATKSISAKAYWEVHTDNDADGWAAGIADSTASFTGSYWGNGGNAHAIAPFGGPGGTVVMIAVDPVAKLFWHGSGGTWTGDPVAGTGGTSFSTFTGAAFPAFQGDSGDKCTVNFGQSPYTFTVPAGYGDV